MGTKGLAMIALLLAGALALAWSNPTAREYEQYQDELMAQALARFGASDRLASRSVVRQLVRSREGQFLKALIRSQTTRTNLGLCSLFNTKLLSTSITVLGIAGTFFPLSDPEEAFRELERSAITPSRQGQHPSRPVDNFPSTGTQAAPAASP